MTYTIPNSVLRANLRSEEVLLNTDTGQYHLLNETGLRVIDRLEAGRTPEEAVSELAESTGTPMDQVEADVAAFLEALLERGLLERRNPA